MWWTSGGLVTFLLQQVVDNCWSCHNFVTAGGGQLLTLTQFRYSSGGQLLSCHNFVTDVVDNCLTCHNFVTDVVDNC